MPQRGFLILIFLLVLTIAAWAVTPQFWEDFTQEELLKGSFNRVSLTPDGKLFLAPAFDLVFDTGQAYIFSMVRDKAGNLYVGTGDAGKVFKIDPQGKGSLYFQSKELDIFAMALDASDTLYVGTSPDGKVYKVSGPNQADEFCDPDSKYIWSMIFDGAGNLYMGTGPNGIIYRVDKNGKMSTFYTCSDNHAVCLARGSNNNILAGTSPGGLIIEITPGGKGFTLMDAPLEEVHSIAFDRYGTIYAIASSLKGFGTSASSRQAAASGKMATGSSQVSITIESVVGLAEKSKESKAVTAPGGEKESVSARSAIYAITKDGSVETIYNSDQQMVFDALVQDNGSLMVATGPKGRLLSIDAAKQVTVISDSPEEDATRLLSAGDVIYVGGSNQGKVYQIRIQKAQTGTFESKTLDARIVSSWGKISWYTANSRSSNIELSTRSGNTEKADNSWSEWSAPYDEPGLQVTSPRARYLQWRAIFKGNSGASAEMLDRVQIAYLQQNARPQVTDIELLPSGIELQKQSSLTVGSMSLVVPATTTDGRSLNSPRERSKERQPLAPRQALQPGAQSFTWKASDDNEDSLEYALYFRGDGESDWKLLEKKLDDTFYTLNTASLPDGAFRLKVVASDAPSNPYDKYLIGELISDRFVIANATPQVEITGNKVNGKKVEAQFRARAAAGQIATAEFSVDGAEWHLVFPVDGIADSAQEEYRIITSELSPGEHMIGIRASDRNGNTGTAKLNISIP
jgi:hypothetical protein